MLWTSRKTQRLIRSLFAGGNEAVEVADALLVQSRAAQKRGNFDESTALLEGAEKINRLASRLRADGAASLK